MDRLLVSLLSGSLVLGGCAGTHKLSGSSEDFSYINEDVAEDFESRYLFGELMRLNNDGLSMESIMTPKMVSFYEKLRESEGGRRKMMQFSHMTRFGNLAMSRFKMHPVGSWGVWEGWMVLEIEGGKIDYFGVSFGAPVGRDSYGAEGGQVADSVTTAIGLSNGLVEANPLMGGVADIGGGLGIGVVKVGVTHLARRYSFESCIVNTPGLESVGWGAAAWNVGMLVGLGPIGLIPAIGVGWYFWPDEEGTFWSCVPEEAHRYAVKNW